jgi:ABC-type polysaccharide/polyol phosphate export permease
LIDKNTLSGKIYRALETLSYRVLGPSRGHYALVVFLLVGRELKVKYRGAFLGYLWSMLNPLAFMTIITFVFSRVVHKVDNYHLYVLSGILMWTMASNVIVIGTHSIANSASLIRKIKMPIWVFPCVPLGAGAVNYVLALVPFFIVSIFSKNFPGFEILYLPLVLILFGIFICGVAITLSCLNVFFKDVGHVLEPLLTLTFYMTPIIYDSSKMEMEPWARMLLNLNPFSHFAEAFRSILLSDRVVTFSNLLLIFELALASAIIGGFVYKTAKPKIAFHL